MNIAISNNTFDVMHREWMTPHTSTDEDKVRLARASIQPLDEIWRHVDGGIAITNAETDETSFMPQAVYDSELFSALERIN